MIKKLRQKKLDAMKALYEKAVGESRIMTDEEKSAYEALKNEVAALNDMIREQEELDKLQAQAAPSVTKEENVASNVVSTPALASSAASIGSGVRVVNEKAYKTLGEQLLAVASATSGDSYAREKLVNAGLDTEGGDRGGFLVQPTFVAGMMEQVTANSVLYGLTTKIPLSGNSNSISMPGLDESDRADGQRFGGVSTQWVPENGVITPSQPKFRNIDIKLAKIMGLVYMTEELMQDSAATQAWVMRAFPADMAFTLDQAIYDGTGQGIPLGLTKSPALVVVPKEGTQGADTVVYENIINMWVRMPVMRRSTSVWLITAEVEAQLMQMSLNVGTGGVPVYLPPGGASTAPYGTLFGRPVISIEQAAALGEQGDIVLADMADYLIIEKGGIASDSSMHVEFLTDRQVFRFRKRVNGTPYTVNKTKSRAKDAFVTSPYITLEAR